MATASSLGTGAITAEGRPARRAGRATPYGATRDRIRWVTAVCSVAFATFALRLPYFGAPLLADEAGYAYVSHAWRSGAVLYREVFIDRPQALLVAYRAVESLFGVSPSAIRAVAALAAALVAAAVCAVARAALPRRSALAAATTFGFVSVAPSLSGFAANGEILAAAPATAAIALALAGAADGSRRAGRARLARLVLAGVLAGSALAVKQSAFDGLAVAGALVAVPRFRAAIRGRPVARRAEVTALGAGLAAAVLAVIAHAVLTCGLGTYWETQVAFRLSLSSAAGHGLGDRLHRLLTSLDLVRPTLLPFVPLVATGLLVARRHFGPGGALIRMWFLACLVGFAIGEAYWTHYYVQLLAPMAVLSAMGAHRLWAIRRHRRARLLGGFVAVTACAAVIVVCDPMFASDGAGRLARAGYSDRAQQATAAGRYLRDHASAGDSVYVLYEGPAIPLLAGIPSAYPYLWWPPHYPIPKNEREVPALLGGATPPVWVAQVDDFDDQSIGRVVAETIRRRYRRVDTVGAVTFYRLSDGAHAPVRGEVPVTATGTEAAGGGPAGQR